MNTFRDSLSVLLFPIHFLGELVLWLLTGGRRGLVLHPLGQLAEPASTMDVLEALRAPSPRGLVSASVGAVVLFIAMLQFG